MSFTQDDNIFDQFRPDPSIGAPAKSADETEIRAYEQAAKAQQREEELIRANSTLPVVIDEVRVGAVSRTKRALLQAVLDPLLKPESPEPTTLAEALQAVGRSHEKLTKLDVFKEPIAVYVNQTESPARPGLATPLSILFQAKEASRYKISSGTDIGNSDGSVYINALLRNVFGGGETLRLDGRKSVRQRAAQSAVFTTPLFHNPDFLLELSALNSSSAKPWSSHEEIYTGGNAAFRYLSTAGHEHSLSFKGAWRQITALSEAASPSIRLEAGDSFKQSVAYSWMVDRRKSLLPSHARVLPCSGYYAKATAELANAAGHGDVSFGKLSFESQAAIPLVSPTFALSASFRAGLLHPLPSGIPTRSDSLVKPSRLMDRFQLGGPTDVRGMNLAGIGPHDGNDSLGGDVFAAGGLSLTGPFPRSDAQTPFRWHLFLNSGRLVGLTTPSWSTSTAQDGSSEKSQPQTTLKEAHEQVKSSVRSLFNGLPTTSAGIGLLYAHPLARFELNFSLPLVTRVEEHPRKGVTFGVGMEFM